MDSMLRSPQRTAALLTLGWVFGVGSPAQTMVEYGHLAGGAANAASSMRKASPAGPLGKLRGSLSDASGAPSGNPSFGSLEGGAPASKTLARGAGEPLAVVRVDWGADASQSAFQASSAETSPSEDVLEQEAEEAVFDPRSAGLEHGMEIGEVSKILGDPVIRTAGLAGRGYDEKVLYDLPTGGRVVVYAADGRARDFWASPSAKKSPQKILPAMGSVIP